MLLTSAIALSSALALRWGVHGLILRGLRAPRLAHLRTPEDSGLSALAVRVPTAQGKTLFAWFVPVPGQVRCPAVVVMHGWGANASLMLPALAPLHAAGFAVLLLDARCHGESDDAAFTSLPRFAEDIEAGLDWLHQQPHIDTQRLAIMGHSVGAGAALLSATRRPDVRAVVSLSAFAHPREVMRTFLAEARIPYPVLGWYVMRHVQAVIGARFDDIAPLASMKRLRCPVLLVHGTEDELVPFADAQRLHAAGQLGAVQCLAVSGGHDPSEALEAHLPALIGFLQQAISEIDRTTTTTDLIQINDKNKTHRHFL
jgi:dipeptidyl aminopeptidase/acylaminoacyl peptidase